MGVGLGRSEEEERCNSEGLEVKGDVRNPKKNRKDTEGSGLRVLASLSHEGICHAK
jgi:hypothetical protein